MEEVTEHYQHAAELFLNQLKVDGKHVTHYEIRLGLIAPGSFFCSGIAVLKYEYETDGTRYTKSVLLKVPSEGILYDQINPTLAYKNEMTMYNEVLPEMYKYWHGETFTAHSYLAPNENHILALENLKESGFRTIDMKTQLNLDEAKIVLQALGKFHALSAKLCEISPNVAQKLTHAFPTEKSGLWTYTLALVARTIRTMEMLNLPEKVVQKMRRYMDSLRQISELCFEDGNWFNVMTHGDLHLGNVLFKFDGDGNPVGVKFVDFQMTRYCSPIRDLIYFFVTSVQTNIFLQHEEELVQEYLSNVNQTLKSLKCDRECYPLEEFKADMDRQKKFYVVIMGTVLGVVLSGAEESEYFTSELYQRSLLKWVGYLEKRGVL